MKCVQVTDPVIFVGGGGGTRARREAAGRVSDGGVEGPRADPRACVPRTARRCRDTRYDIPMLDGREKNIPRAHRGPRPGIAIRF